MLQKFMEFFVSLIQENPDHWLISKNYWQTGKAWSEYYQKKVSANPKYRHVTVSFGAEKIVFIFSTFVVKVFHCGAKNDVDAEYILYNESKEWEIGFLFAETRPPKTISVDIDGQTMQLSYYWQKKATGQKRYKNPCTTGSLYPSYRQHELMFNFLGEDLGAVIIAFFGLDIALTLDKFMETYDINDMHCNNFAIYPRSKKVVLYDFAGYN